MHAVPDSFRWGRANAPHWWEWLRRAPAFVAEDLRPVHDPLGAWLRPGPPAHPARVAAALARAFLPGMAPDPPPVWLREDQGLSYRRALNAVRRFGGALLADPVGTGKTYVALAVAARLDPDRPIDAIIPAGLRAQWLEAAERTGLAIRIHSHETLSRGRIPKPGGGALIVDESHRFRESGTTRYQVMCRWCVGRQGLLLSATPAVNRLEDVANQLLLLVRNDALAWRGATTLLEARFAELVITGADRSGALPARRDRDTLIPLDPESPGAEILFGIDALALSADPGVASIIRLALLQSFASSPPALEETLGRYRALLLHATDAAGAGYQISRQRIKGLVGAALNQLLLWPLVAESDRSPTLLLQDLDPVSRLIARTRDWGTGGDSKLDALRQLTLDRHPTLVFTSHVATVRHIRTGLGRSGVAWCTGHSAGLDHSPSPRDDVLRWFQRALPPHPSILVTTDVAAEGFDLPRFERVVHYDQPWTAVRLEQRSGRAIRLSTLAPTVEVIRFRPDPVLEARMRKETIIDRKGLLPQVLGLGTSDTAPWRLRARIAELWNQGEAAEGTAWVPAAGRSMVAGFRLVGADGVSREVVRAWTPAGWNDDPEIVASLLAVARGHPETLPLTPTRLRLPLQRLSTLVRGSLSLLHGVTGGCGRQTPPARRLIRRIRRLAGSAVRRRRGEELSVLERGLQFGRRGHTAGEAALITDLLKLGDVELVRRLGVLPAARLEEIVRVEVIGILMVEPRPPAR